MGMEWVHTGSKRNKIHLIHIKFIIIPRGRSMARPRFSPSTIHISSFPKDYWLPSCIVRLECYQMYIWQFYSVVDCWLLVSANSWLNVWLDRSYTYRYGFDWVVRTHELTLIDIKLKEINKIKRKRGSKVWG